MLEVTRRRVDAHGLDSGRVEFVHADILEWPAPRAAYDLVVTHFVLDCFRPEQLARVLPSLARAAAPLCVVLLNAGAIRRIARRMRASSPRFVSWVAVALIVCGQARARSRMR